MNAREEKYFQQGLLEGNEFEAAGREAVQARVRTLASLLELPADEARRQVIADYKYRLDALPAVSKFPELAGMRECVTAYDRGLSERSGLEVDDVIIFRNYLHTVTGVLRAEQGAPCVAPASEPGCTLVYFPDSDRGPLVANNTDDLLRPNFQTQPVWLVANRAGLIVGTVSNGLHGDEVSPEIFPAPVFLMVYEMCQTVGEASELLTRLNLFWGPCNCLIADRHGNSVVIEKSSCRYGLRESNDGFSATTAMAAEEPSYKNYLWQTRERSLTARGLDKNCIDWAYWKAAESRSQKLLQMTLTAQAQPTYQALEEIIYQHDGAPDQIHLDGNKCHRDEENPNWTLRTAIHVLNENCTFYSFPEPPKGGHLTARLRKDYVLEEPIF